MYMINFVMDEKICIDSVSLERGLLTIQNLQFKLVNIETDSIVVYLNVRQYLSFENAS